MSIYTTLRSWLGGNANSQQKGGQVTTPASTPYDGNMVTGIDSSLQVSTVWACVSLLVDTIATLPIKTYINNGSERKEDKSSSIAIVLRRRPNKRQTAIQFWMQIVFNYVLKGNGYARIIRNSKGEVIALLPMSSDQVEVIIDDNGGLLYVYSINEKQFIFAQHQVFHLCGMGNGVVGMSPLDYMKSSVTVAVAAQNHTGKVFNKNARRPGILMSDTVLTDAQRAKVKKNFSDIAKGTEGELYLLEAQFKFDPLGMSPSDIQLLETRQYSVQDLARWFGVPSVLINDNAETTALGSGVYEIIQAFYKLRLRPKIELFEQAMQEQLLTRVQISKGYEIEFDLSTLLRASEKDRMDIESKAVQNGLRTRNESRAKNNEGKIDGGDILTAQTNLMPLHLLGTQNTSGTVSEDTIRQ